MGPKTPSPNTIVGGKTPSPNAIAKGEKKRREMEEMEKGRRRGGDEADVPNNGFWINDKVVVLNNGF